MSGCLGVFKVNTSLYFTAKHFRPVLRHNWGYIYIYNLVLCTAPVSCPCRVIRVVHHLCHFNLLSSNKDIYILVYSFVVYNVIINRFRGNPYDLGWRHNWYIIFGTHPLGIYHLYDNDNFH